jgi:hypothetical protein
MSWHSARMSGRGRNWTAWPCRMRLSSASRSVPCRSSRQIRRQRLGCVALWDPDNKHLCEALTKCARCDPGPAYASELTELHSSSTSFNSHPVILLYCLPSPPGAPAGAAAAAAAVGWPCRGWLLSSPPTPSGLSM